jgi:hypothetical protein
MDTKTSILFSRSLQEIESYKDFPSAWDGYRGLEFSESMIHRASYIIQEAERFFSNRKKLPHDITIGPASDGTIDIQIDYNDKFLTFLLDDEKQTISCFKKSSLNKKEIIISDEKTSLEKEFLWLIK